MPDSKITHDTERLRALASTFDNVKAKFETLAGSGDHVRAAFGSAEVADAYGEFVGGWSRKREDLARDLEKAATSLRDIAGRYDELEAELSRAATPEGGGKR